MKIEHRPGRLHGNADEVSRIPCRQCGRSKEDDNKSDQLVISQLYSIDTATEGKEITEVQNEDPDICQVKSWLAAETRPVYKDIGSGGYFLKSLWSQWKRLDLMDGILVRRWEISGTDIVYWQAIVPLKHRREILKYAHDIKASGHLGVTKTLNKERQRY